MILVEFTLTGPALSLQTRNRVALRRWKLDVHAGARACLVRRAHAPEDVFFSIGDFRWTGNRPDTDNIIKPAQDALTGLVYDDDRQVRDTLGFTRANLAFVPITLGLLPALQTGLVSGLPFVHVAVSTSAAPHFEGVVDA
ncbi:MAG: RusA family crossover junction endodeoxyribonuclease [Patulibacter minatonensis]